MDRGLCETGWKYSKGHTIIVEKSTLPVRTAEVIMSILDSFKTTNKITKKSALYSDAGLTYLEEVEKVIGDSSYLIQLFPFVAIFSAYGFNLFNKRRYFPTFILAIMLILNFNLNKGE